MTDTPKRQGRRAFIAGSGAVAATGLAAAFGSSPASAAQPMGDTSDAKKADVVNDELKVVDDKKHQRFLVQDTKPPAIVNGKPYQRQGPNDATYVIFNDQNGNETGGIVASSTGTFMGFDYPSSPDGYQGFTSQGIVLQTESGKDAAAAGMVITDRQVTNNGKPVQHARASLEYVQTKGTSLSLMDSQGRPRIVLEVDGNDVPSIKILDADGKVGWQVQG